VPRLAAISSIPPAPAAAAAANPDPPNASLPDPSPVARGLLAIALALAIGASLLMNRQGWTGKVIAPRDDAFQFSLFAAFYVAAQAIERLMELITPWLPAWKGIDLVKTSTAAEDVAQVKADRAKLALGVATVIGVIAANAFGLYLMSKVGIETSHTVDAFFTGLVIAAGTKPLHDFISFLGSQTSPKTGTTVV
jgi:hypothetical protein